MRGVHTSSIMATGEQGKDTKAGATTYAVYATDAKRVARIHGQFASPPSTSESRTPAAYGYGPFLPTKYETSTNDPR
jgi:hypothetical protein